MNITLERILSLIPKNEDGKFKHGALKEFAGSIGLKSGNLIADWINGRSKSYGNYVYEISDKYNVSVDWLLGNTDKKEKTPVINEGLDDDLIELFKVLSSLPQEKRQDVVRGMLDILR